jgi:hypothetical protein
MRNHAPNDSERLLVRPRRACHLLDCGTTHLYELIDSGELESFLDGRSRKIVVASIHRLIAKRLADKQAGLAVPPHHRHGRPREAAAAVLTNEVLASTQASNSVPQRRRRGRPRKETIERSP